MTSIIKKYIGILILTLIIIGGIIIFIFDPEDGWWFPKCPFKTLTGYDCPSCGAQRAIHQFLHLNFYEAFRLNPFFIIGIPYLSLAIFTNWIMPQDKCIRLRRFTNSTITASVYIFFFFAWWIIRNII